MASYVECGCRRFRSRRWRCLNRFGQRRFQLAGIFRHGVSAASFLRQAFQLRNRAGYEVEVLLAKALAADYPRSEQLSPIPLEEQDWLLLGQQVAHVIVGRDGTAAKVIVPDPRYFALHKLWLAEKPTRSALKRPKDFTQGNLVLDAVHDFMPQFPLTEAFYAALPEPLQKHYRAWMETRALRPAKSPERPRW